MKRITFNSNNELKLQNARAVCEGYGIAVEQATHDPAEIQSEDPEAVALDKAR